MAQKQSDYINLIVQSFTNEKEGENMFFNMKKTSIFKKLFSAYAIKLGISDPNSIRFFYEGERLTPYLTPKDLKMEDDDKILAAFEQVGGNR